MDNLAQALLKLDTYELSNFAPAIKVMSINEDGAPTETSHVAEALIEWANEAESDFDR